MIKNFAIESVDFIREGAPVCSEEQYKERITLCVECPEFKPATKSCGLCGCHMPVKAKWKTASCPATPPKWDALVFNPKEMEIAKLKNEKEKEEYMTVNATMLSSLKSVGKRGKK